MNEKRFLENLETLGQIGWKEGEGLFRTAFSPLFAEGRDFVSELMKSAGMDVRVDGVGNLFGKYPGSGEGARTVLLGSHLDSVPGGGKYDGHLGVVAALEAAQALHEKGPHRHALEVVGFNAEEGGEMGGTFGSRAVCGDLGPLPDAAALESLGLSEEKIAAARMDLSNYLCYLEMHIEQGPVLWRRQIPVGIPTAIVGITRYRVEIEGEANHAGTTPMEERKDAMKGATRLLSSWYDWLDAEIARADRPEFVCNVGSFSLQPGAAPVVPGLASFVLELRSTQDTVVGMLADRFRKLLPAAELPAKMSLMVEKPAVELDPELRTQIRAVCDEMKFECLDMPSGAGHDASPMARHLPSAMLFVPSIRGISHSREEKSDATDMVRGVKVLERLVERLDSRDSI